MGVLTAALYSVALWIAGLDLIWTWAVLTVVLSFVPTIGSVIAGALPTAYALLTRDLGTAAIVGLSLLAIEQVIGNFVDPRVSGDQVKLSPLVVLIALLVWTWVWGAPGAILAVPMTLALVVLGARIEPLRPLALMMTDEGDMDGLDEAATA
jgi:AI-2 transport protein TqsA